MRGGDVQEGGGSSGLWRNRTRQMASDMMEQARERLSRSGSIMDVTMLGPTGAGKTTLLASMYERFSQVIGRTDLAIVATDQKTSQTMEGYIKDLKGMTRKLIVESGINSTGAIREYRFDVGRKGRRPLFALRFTDYPGGTLMDDRRGSAEEKERIERALYNANVVLVAIDTPALVWHNGEYHDDVNHPGQVRDQIMRMLRADIPRLIILAPLKCERYVQDEASAKRLRRLIVDTYKPLTDAFSGGDPQDRTGCVITPVQTLGSVRFQEVQKDDNGDPIFRFRTREITGSVYQPVDTDQPLRYAMRFLVGNYRDSAGLMRTGLNKLLGNDDALVAAMESFAEGCKTDRGFGVVQYHPYLNSKQ